MNAQLLAQVYTILWILLAVTGTVLIIYITGAVKTSGSFVQTEWKKDTAIDADQVYYLPSSCLQVKATASVIVTKDAETNTIKSAVLAALSFDTTVEAVADTRYPLAIRYTSSAFSNDDLKFSVNPSGLLDGINLSAEDRIGNIITELTESPKIILSGDAAGKNAFKTGDGGTGDGELVVTETKEYTNTFLILTEEIRNKVAVRTWEIIVDGTAKINTTVDASFGLKFDVLGDGSVALDKIVKASTGNDPLKAGTLLKKLDGILSRPLCTIVMSVHVPDTSTVAAIKYQLAVPDESRVIATPVKRSAFVKKTYGLKLVNGVLTENAINKPSEMEGFMRIPVNIGKAIVSIPAQLLSFKIETIKRRTTLETEQQNFSRAELQTRKDMISGGTELLKAQLDAQKAALTFESEISKTKLEAEKTLLEAQKNIIAANTDLSSAKKDWENAKKELEALLKNIREERENKQKIGQNAEAN